MSYFDSRVDEGPVWQVVLIKVVKVCAKTDIVAFIVSENRINHFEIEQVNRTTSEHWKLPLLADSNKELIQKYLRLGSPWLKVMSV